MEAHVSAASAFRPWFPPPDASDIVKGIHAMLGAVAICVGIGLSSSLR